MLITPEYKEMQTAFHAARLDYGISGHKHADIILNFAKQMSTRDILDYGCGKATLQKSIPFPIQNYDPCMPEYDRPPTRAALVCCTDVLEHIEPIALAAVLDDLRRLTGQMLFINVATGPAKKILPDGRNAHLIQETGNWWLSWLLPRFLLHSFQASPGDFTAILVPLASPGPKIELGPEQDPHAAYADAREHMTQGAA